MGNSRWSPDDWDKYATKKVRGKSRAEVFTSRSIKDAYNPAKIKVRESCDSVKNPNATPIIIGSDVTGSMGQIADKLMQDGLNTLCEEIYTREPVPDPHIMCMAIGDAVYDKAPLQVTQFEADICLADQVRDLWIEGCGGANDGESYSGAHLFAAMKTNIDAAKKRNAKGYLFTIGDEPNLNGYTRDQANRFLGISLEADVSAEAALALAQRNWEVFHVALVNEGYCKRSGGLGRVLHSWQALLPERTIQLDDVNDLAETIVSVIQVHQGANATEVADSWSGDTSLVVANALRELAVPQGGSGGITRLV